MSQPAPKRRLLFFSPLLAMPSQHGGCVYPHALLTEFHRQGWEIDYAWIAAPLRKGRPIMRNPLNAPYIRQGWMMGAATWGRFIFATPRWSPRGPRPPVGHWFAKNGGEHLATREEKLFASAVIHRCQPTCVLVDTTPMLTVLDGLPKADRPGIQVAVLTHNLISRRTDLYRQYNQPLDFLPLSADEEAALLNRADTIVAIQEREAEAFRKLVPAKRVVTIPMPFEPKPIAADLQVPGRCLFVGGYSGHNIEAAHWLLEQVWPRVRAQSPQAELVIAGTVSRAIQSPPPGVVLRGPVENLKEEYAKTSVCLVPLPLGTGLKIKLVEAMSHGRAVVTTSAGAEGFADIEEGRVAEVADGAGMFADAVARLLGDATLRERVVERQTAWLRLNLQPKTVLRPLTDALATHVP